MGETRDCLKDLVLMLIVPLEFVEAYGGGLLDQPPEQFGIDVLEPLLVIKILLRSFYHGPHRGR